MPEVTNPIPLPNLSEPRLGKSEAKPNGVGLFFAVVKTALNKCNWKRADFESILIAEGQLQALEKHFETIYAQSHPVNASAAPESDLQAAIDAPPVTEPVASEVVPPKKEIVNAPTTPVAPVKPVAPAPVKPAAPAVPTTPVAPVQPIPPAQPTPTAPEKKN